MGAQGRPAAGGEGNRGGDRITEPTLRILSLGAGVQSTTLALMACDGTLPGLDAAIFADTGWEPPAVYRQVKRLSEDLWWKHIPTYRVSKGNLRTDTIDHDSRFVSVPRFTLAPEDATTPVEIRCPNCDGTGVFGDEVCHTCEGMERIPDPSGARRPMARTEREGMGRRQCTAEYKLSPILRQVRKLLGAEPPDFRRVPKGRLAEQWIGFSTDEIHRVNDRQENLYTVKRYPLIELGMSRKDCERWLKAKGWGHTVKSACIGCPMHGNAAWRDLRDNHPKQWQDAVEFDRQIRKGGARGEQLRGEAFLHRSRVPLDQAPIDRVTPKEWADRQLDIFDALEDGDPDGCSPYGCRSGEPVDLEDAS